MASRERKRALTSVVYFNELTDMPGRDREGEGVQGGGQEEVDRGREQGDKALWRIRIVCLYLWWSSS